ncbi:hypothetical protein EV648_110204 [Kribbella sp. VKM Ac-2568]|nr:hypothetical protein EV648_110204 [Kribbella sp. VKM Ac-2568]
MVREQNSSALSRAVKTRYPGCRTNPSAGGKSATDVTSAPPANLRVEPARTIRDLVMRMPLIPGFSDHRGTLCLDRSGRQRATSRGS